MVQLTYFATPENSRPTTEAAPAEAEAVEGATDGYHVRHGYMLADVDRLVRTGILRNAWYAAVDRDERYATGWHAAIELLYTATEPPTPKDLIHAAWYAADEMTCRTGEQRGVPRARGPHYRGRTDLPRFHAYWTTVSRHTASPEDMVVDRVALAQIWPQLREVDREALSALAAHGDYELAASALGMKYHTFCARIKKARGRFHRLWHEGETPRMGWRDKRRGLENAGSVSRRIRRRARAGVA